MRKGASIFSARAMFRAVVGGLKRNVRYVS